MNKNMIPKGILAGLFGLIVLFITIFLLGKKSNDSYECLKFTYKEDVSKQGKSCPDDYYDCVLSVNGMLYSGNVKVRIYDEYNNEILTSEINQAGPIEETVRIRDVSKDNMYYMEVSKSKDLDADFSVTLSGRQYEYQKVLDFLIKLLPYRIQK